MSLTAKRQLLNVNYDQTRPLNSNNIDNSRQYVQSLNHTMSHIDNTRNNINSTIQKHKSTRHSDSSSEYSALSNQFETSRIGTLNDTQQLFDRTIDNSMNRSSRQNSLMNEILHSRFDPDLEEIKREIKRNKQDQQRRLIRSLYDEEINSLQNEYPLQMIKRQINENEINRQLLASMNSGHLCESTKSIRENVTQFKNYLLRTDDEYETRSQSSDALLSLTTNRRRRAETDPIQMENEYLIKRQTILSKSAILNEMLSFKRELEKSEQIRQELTDKFESLREQIDEKEKLLSKTSTEMKQVNENCDIYEKQNHKLQHDLTLALEKLEEMTVEAEKFAQESLIAQKQLANSEQKHEEFQIQTQETNKQWKARLNKLEKENERHKTESSEILEKNQELKKEIDSLKIEISNLKEQNAKFEIDLNEVNINCNEFQEQCQRFENENIQLRSIRSSQESEIVSLKGKLNNLENQFSIQRQNLSQTEKKTQNLQKLLQDETNYRNNLEGKLKQSDQEFERLNGNYSQFQRQLNELENEKKNLSEKVKQLEFERDSLSKEKSKYLFIENNYEDIQKKFELAKSDYARSIKALQIDYENKIEMFQLQLNDEKGRNSILERYQIEHNKEIERLQQKSGTYEDEITEAQSTIERLSRDNNEKARLTSELESKINKLSVETMNIIHKKDKDYQNYLHTIYNDIILCTERMSNDSNQPFIFESSAVPRDDLDVCFSKINAHLSWLKHELDIRQQQEKKLREQLDKALLDCETDREHFATELAKREILINQLTTDIQQENSSKIHEYTNTEHDRQRVLTEDERDRYRQFQIMIDSVKRELHTAKAQLLS